MIFLYPNRSYEASKSEEGGNMELITIKTIQQLYGVGRKTAVEWADRSGAALKRERGQTYRVDRSKLEGWLRRQRT